MTMGERIQRLRKQQGLSQEELATRIGVTRQTISKWELDQSVPEAAVIAQLSDMFGVTTDHLIKGERAPVSPPAPPAAVPNVVQPSGGISVQQIVGIVLLAVALLFTISSVVLARLPGLSLPFLLLCAAPLYLCGLICLIAKKRAALWCGWVLYGCAGALPLFVSTMALLQPQEVLMLLLLVPMILWSVRAFRDKTFTVAPQHGLYLIGGWILYAVLLIAEIAMIVSAVTSPEATRWEYLPGQLFHLFRRAVLTADVVWTVCCIKNRRT